MPVAWVVVGYRAKPYSEITACCSVKYIHVYKCTYLNLHIQYCITNVASSKSVSVDFVQSPVGRIVCHHHGLIVFVDSSNSEGLVGTKADDGGRVAGRRDNTVTVLVSLSFNDTPYDGLLFFVLQLGGMSR